MQTANLVLLSTQDALQKAMDVVANNIANASTTAFKREDIAFATYISRPESGQKLSFVVPRATFRDSSNGPIAPTHNPLDLAIQGQGYFQVRGADGQPRFTRNGSFQLDTQGQIVTHAGQPVLSSAGQPITIPDTATDINISGDGYITAKTDNGTSLAELGKIAVVKFDDDQKLQSEGSGLFTSADPSKPATDSSVVQGSLEQSNVSAVTEMTQMIKIMRSYEQASGLISKEDDRRTEALTKLSKTTA